MNIYLPGQKIVINPIGRNVIGAMGRIDMIGHNGNLKFLLVDKEFNGPKITSTISGDISKALENKVERTSVKYSWKIATPAPNIKFITLNEDSFSDALLGVVDQ